MTEKTETDEKTVKNTDTDTDKMMMRDKKAAAESDTETKKKDKQTIIAAMTEAVTAAATETDTEMKKTVSFRSKMNIRLLTAIQMILKVLFIF